MVMTLKTWLLGPLVKYIVKHPQIMESRLFLKTMATFPARISKTYDQKITAGGYEYEAALEEGLKRLPTKPRQALDLATGTGFAAFKMAETFPDATIEAIDQAENMIQLAREKTQEKGVENIYFRTGNALALDYTDEKFDLLVTSNAPVYLREAARILKPGGYMLVTFSFLGAAIIKARKEIVEFLENHGFKLVKLETAAKGAFVLGRKKESDRHGL